MGLFEYIKKLIQDVIDYNNTGEVAKGNIKAVVGGAVYEYVDNVIGDAIRASEEYTDRRFKVIEQSGAGYLEPNEDLPLVSFDGLGGGNYLAFCKVNILASIPSTDKGFLRVAYNSGQLSPSLVYEAGREYSENILSFTDYITNADDPLEFTLVNYMDVMADSYTISARVVLIRMD